MLRNFEIKNNFKLKLSLAFISIVKYYFEIFFEQYDMISQKLLVI
jgi:hypothetical protein